MLAAVLVLAQTVAATPSPVPPTPTPVPTTAASSASPPSATRKLSGGFGRKLEAPGKTKVVVTDEALTPSRKAGTFSVSGTRTPAKTGATAEVEGPEPTGKAGDEATWKARVATLRAELAQAEKDYDVADRANTVVAFGEAGNEYQTMMAIRNAALTPYRMKLDELRSALAALPEECRRTSGCQPGWVR